jgi:tRNA threonylcarbamoyladenosine modification (KEOPS) complex Cgi121 subunit
VATHDQMPWFPAWGMKFKDPIIDTNETLSLFNQHKPDNRWLLLAFDAAASEKHLWTAWYSMRRNKEREKMIAKSSDAEFIRLIAGTHQVKIAFNNAGIRSRDNLAWIIRLPESDIGDGIKNVVINRDSYNNYDSEANILIEKMNGELMSQRPTPTLKGLTRIGYDKEINITHSLEEYFILHLVSSKI